MYAQGGGHAQSAGVGRAVVRRPGRVDGLPAGKGRLTDVEALPTPRSRRGQFTVLKADANYFVTNELKKLAPTNKLGASISTLANHHISTTCPAKGVD